MRKRLALSGVSDGGTAVYYVAMRDTTPFSSFLPLNGFILVLANPSMGLREGLFPNNLRNKAFAAARRRAQHGLVA